MLGSLERHLQRHNYGQSVISEFPITKKALAAKQKELKSLGKGQKPKAASSLSGSDIDALYSSRQLGLHTPTSVVNTMWYNCMMHFGMRATTEHKSMTWGDVQLKRDAELNLEYVEFRERTTKTRTGANIPDIRSCPPRMYETPENPGRCPVTAFKFYEGRTADRVQQSR